MKEIKIASLLIVGTVCASAYASALSVPVKAAIKGYEKAAVKLGIRAAEKPVVQGGAKLAAVTAEREAAKNVSRGAVKAIAQEATPKKILAIGAATAMVVSGHEAADGVQKYLDEKGKGERAMGDGVGKAAEKNPEVAIAVGTSATENSLTAYMKYFYLAGVSVLVVFGAWFLWPWVALVRNLSALAARRRAAAIRGGEVIDVTPMPVDNIEPTSRSGFSRLEVIFVVSACLFLTVLGVWRMATSGGVPITEPIGGEPPTADERIARRKAVVAKLHATYVDSLENHYRNFLSDIEHVGNTQFGIVRMGIPAVVAKFGTFSRCKDLFRTIVADKLKGGDETGNSIRRDLEADYYKDLYAARDRVYGCLEAFIRNVECARETFKLELETELDAVELPGDDAYKALLVECGERIEQRKEDLKWGQIDAGIALALEAVCIRQTVATVAKILGKAAGRQAGTMAVGAGAAVADGPLPVMDALAVVAVVACTAWSVRDVYKAMKVLPEELRTTLEATARKCERQTLDEVKSSGEKVYRVYCTGKTT